MSTEFVTAPKRAEIHDGGRNNKPSADALRAKDLTILEIKTQKTGLGADVSECKIPFLSDQPPGLKQVSIFSKQFSTLINAGVPLFNPFLSCSAK